MNLPGFAAEFSLYQRSGFHRMFAGAPESGGVVPQFQCGACTCDPDECCFYTPGPGGDCACVGRINGKCPPIGRLRPDRFLPYVGGDFSTASSDR